MNISKVILKGFRNFKEATINFTHKTLIIGANDVGKTNLLYAVRMLLDRSFSELDIEPLDSDFFVYENTNEFSITLFFADVTEIIRTKFKEHIGENDTFVLKYVANRNPENGKKSYKILVGVDDDDNVLDELKSRYYTRFLNVKYISSNRDLSGFIKREKKYLLQEAKDEREDTEANADLVKQNEVTTKLGEINTSISQLNYVQKATDGINTELKELSIHHESHKVILEVGSQDTSIFIDNAGLASMVNGTKLALGGDGRNNQIFLSLWASRNKIDEDNPTEVTFFCIEEPEAHLHPHQQRKLAEYLAKNLNSQVIITSHSPQIASRFAPSAIVKLGSCNLATKAASDGCTSMLETTFIEFGHRLDIISAEVFFSNVVFLVEGQSEVLFYKALARAIGVDLDRLNISVLMVNGVGFNTYIEILNALEIPWVLRTDNDIIKTPRKAEYRCAGVQRAFGFFCKSHGINLKDETTFFDSTLFKELVSKMPNLKGLVSPVIEKSTQDLIEKYRNYLLNYNIFISDYDLEEDIANSELKETVETFILDYTNKKEIDDILVVMQKKKATFMYDFLQENEAELAKLSTNKIAKPLFICKKIAEQNAQY